MERTKQTLNNDIRTKTDERNNEARQHEGHDLFVVRSSHIEHPTTNGYDEVDVICMECNRQYKAYVWRTVRG